jgi:hypothetical protein
MALGNLRAESATGELVKELLDDNPAIVRAAAQSLEKVMGASGMATRVLEDTVKTRDRARIRKYSDALRDIDDQIAVTDTLEREMSSISQERRDTARELMSHLGGPLALEKLRASEKKIEEVMSLMKLAEDRIQNDFNKVTEEARTSFSVTTKMDQAWFYVGLGIIGISALVFMFIEHDFAGWLGFGVAEGTGIFSTLYSKFYSDPRRRIEESARGLMYMNIIFLGYLRRLYHIDLAFWQRLIEGGSIEITELNGYNRSINTTMNSAIHHMQKVKHSKKGIKVDEEQDE